MIGARVPFILLLVWAGGDNRCNDASRVVFIPRVHNFSILARPILWA